MLGYLDDEWKQLAVMARFDCKELAKLNNVSVRQLQRVFRTRFGQPPQDWLNEQRIVAAQQLLRIGNSTKRVALDLGFKQTSHFCRQFKIISGITPSQFKNSMIGTTRVAIG